MIDGLRMDPSVRSALDALRESGSHDDALARVAWSVLAEPGDGVAGALIAELGAAESLRLVVDDADALRRGEAGRAVADGLRRWRARMEGRGVDEALRGAQHVDARLLIPGDEDWPAGLDDLGAHAPLLLWVRGDATLLRADPRVAIVGARASTGYGEMLAADFAGELALSGAVIVSGGAYGVDGAAHRAALSVQGGTIAILAGGIDRAYPQGHRQLLGRIVDAGAVVSEVPCGTAPTKWRFLARNRLIAAASDATVVVEAGWRSGSINTAGHAAALGRPLGAVPGPVTAAASAGCHRLLREYDARCVTTTAEIRELWEPATGSPLSPQSSDPEQQRVWDAMGDRTAVPVRELSRRSGVSPERVSAILGMFELNGVVVRLDGGWRKSR